jgi:hypothetical protein
MISVGGIFCSSHEDFSSLPIYKVRAQPERLFMVCNIGNLAGIYRGVSSKNRLIVVVIWSTMLELGLRGL